MPDIQPRRVACDDLDALALEEEQALRAEAAAPAPPPPGAGSPFASDEEFLVRAVAHLAAHPEPSALLNRLSEPFAPQPRRAEAAHTQPPATDAEEPLR